MLTMSASHVAAKVAPTGSTAVLEAELDLEVLPEAGETFPGENGPIPAGL